MTALLCASLLSGCATVGSQSGPAALGAGKHRSIKDDPEPATASPSPQTLAPAPKRPPVRIATIPPPRPPHTVTPKNAPAPSCGSGSDCTAQLKAMIDDTSRGWIRQRQRPVEYANGTRLFAYRALRHRLSCAEITLALSEIDAAAVTFRSPVPGVDAAQAAHLLKLNADVGQELRIEFASRCRT
jgi:hypothetical protein